MPSSIQVTATISLQDNGAVTFEVGPSLSFGGDLARLLTGFLSDRPGSELVHEQPSVPTSPNDATTAGVIAVAAARLIRAQGAAAPGVHHSTVRRMVARCELLATRGERRESLIPLWQLDRSGRPPRRLKDVLEPFDKELRHDPELVEWFAAARLPNSRERPIDLLLRDDDADVTKVATAFAAYVARRD